MKSNEEMVRSVLRKVEREQLRQSRIRKTLISAVACFCVVAVAVIGAARVWSPEESPVSSAGSRLSVFTVNAAEYKSMVKDVLVPSGLMHVRNVKGCSELERVFIRREEINLIEEYTKGAWRSSLMRQEKDNAIFVMGWAEVLMVMPEDIEQVSEFSARSKDGSSFGAAINPTKDKKSGEICRGIEIWWQPPEEQVNMLLKEPDTKLSIVSDTITVTVTYTDGTTESVMIDVTVDDDGIIYMTHRGAK